MRRCASPSSASPVLPSSCRCSRSRRPCAVPTGRRSRHRADADNWPQWHGPNRDNLSADNGLLRQWDADGPTLAWQASGLGAGFSSLAIVGDRIFTMGDLGGEQYRASRCRRRAASRSGRRRSGPAWDDQYPGPRGTPTVDGALLYALGTEGDLVCLETATGKERWRRSLPRDFGGQMMSGWKFSESPLVDGDRVIVTPGARDAGLVALDKRTGKEVWRASVPELGAARPRRRGLLVDRDLERRRREAVRAAARPRPGRRPRRGRQVPVGLQPRRQRRRQHRDADREGRLRLRVDRLSDRQRAAEARRRRAPGWSRPTRSTSSTGGRSRTTTAASCSSATTSTAVRGTAWACRSASSSRPARSTWGGDIRNEGRGSAAITYADGNLYFRYENGLGDADRRDARRLPAEGHAEDPRRRAIRAGRIRSSSAASCICASRTSCTSTSSEPRSPLHACGRGCQRVEGSEVQRRRNAYGEAAELSTSEPLIGYRWILAEPPFANART